MGDDEQGRRNQMCSAGNDILKEMVKQLRAEREQLKNEVVVLDATLTALKNNNQKNNLN